MRYIQYAGHCLNWWTWTIGLLCPWLGSSGLMTQFCINTSVSICAHYDHCTYRKHNTISDALRTGQCNNGCILLHVAVFQVQISPLVNNIIIVKVTLSTKKCWPWSVQKYQSCPSNGITHTLVASQTSALRSPTLMEAVHFYTPQACLIHFYTF